MTNKTETIKVPSTEADIIQRWLDSEKPISEAGRCEVVTTYTAKFGDGIEADIKVCNSESSPYIDAVLFEDGFEIGLLDVSDVLLGEYIFIVDDNTYTVLVEKRT